MAGEQSEGGLMADTIRQCSLNKPTVNGFYWLERRHRPPLILQVCLCELGPHEAAILYPGSDEDLRLAEIDGLWTGPLVPPGEAIE